MPSWNEVREFLATNAAVIQVIVAIAGVVGGVLFFLRRQIAAAISVLRARLRRRRQLQRQLKSIRSGGTLTKQGLSLGDLVDSHTLWLEPRLVEGSPHAGAGSEFTEAEFYAMLDERKSVPRIAVLARGGAGKSTLAQKLFLRVGRSRLGLSSSWRRRRFPLFIDLSAVDDSTVGEVVSRVAEHSGTDSLIIFDGVDELVTAGMMSPIRKVLNAIPSDCAVALFCRSAAFNSYIRGLPQLTLTKVLSFQEAKPSDLEAYSVAILTGPYALSSELVGRYHDLLKKAITMGVLTTPLTVALAASCLVDGGSDSANYTGRVDNLAMVYESFTSMILVRENAKPGAPLSYGEVYEILKRLAALKVESFSARRVVHTTGVTATWADMRAAARTVLGSHRVNEIGAALGGWISNRTLLRQRSNREGNDLYFVHPSFFEFILAQRIVDCLQSDRDAAKRLLERFVTQEVYQFLKYLLLERAEANQVDAIVEGAFQIFDDYERTGIQAGSVAELVVEQVLHLVGHVADKEAAARLIQVYNSSESLFLKRGIAIGLAFGGHSELVEAYTEQLRNELLLEGVGELNRVNLACILAYFGETGEYSPERASDASTENVACSVRKLIGQLASDVHRASRDIDLYSLTVLFRQWGTKVFSEIERCAFAELLESTCCSSDCESGSLTCLLYDELVKCIAKGE